MISEDCRQGVLKLDDDNWKNLKYFLLMKFITETKNYLNLILHDSSN